MVLPTASVAPSPSLSGHSLSCYRTNPPPPKKMQIRLECKLGPKNRLTTAKRIVRHVGQVTMETRTYQDKSMHANKRSGSHGDFRPLNVGGDRKASPHLAVLLHALSTLCWVSEFPVSEIGFFPVNREKVFLPAVARASRASRQGSASFIFNCRGWQACPASYIYSVRRARGI